ncbi:MAG: hypothetical protein AB1Z23_11860 [Eubacteriales bacterium]
MKEIVKITKRRLKNHLLYNKWIYLAVIILIVIVVNFSYIVTRPELPKENRVNIIMYAGITDEDILSKWQDEMLVLLPDDQRAVNILARSSVNAETQSAMVVRFLAGEDDIIIIANSDVESLANQSAFLPLDEYMDMDKLTSKYSDLNIENYKMKIEGSDEEHVYWLPLAFSEGFSEIGFPPDNLSIGIVSNSSNVENAVKCLEYLIYK